ncbi:MAG: CotH kinase family protein [Bacteroidia bacterium]|nr:CotH kinase family protein [Bacteroidia bacterium]
MRKIINILLLSAWVLLSSCGGNAAEGHYKTTAGNLFDDTQVHELRFYFYDENGWENLYRNKKLRDSLEMTRYLPVKIVIDSFKIDSAGLRFKGESSFLYTKGNKKSFKVSLARFRKESSYGKVRTFNLNNCFKDPTFLREKLMLDLLRDQGLPAPASAFVKVYVNDEYLGLYLAVEEIGKHFLDTHFTNHDGNLYLGEPNALLQDLGPDPSAYQRKYKKKRTGKDTTYTDIALFIGELNRGFKKNKDKKYMEHLESILNTDQLLKTWAICNLLADADAFNMMYRHNYALYHEPSSGKWQWVTWDHNLAFAAWNPKYTLEQVYTLAPDHTEDFEGEHFQKRVLGNSYLRKRYLRYMAELVKGPFSIDRLGGKIDRWAVIIRPHVAADSLKACSTEDFDKNLQDHLGDPTDPGAFTPGLKSFIIKRRNHIIRELKNRKMFDAEPEA